MIKHRTQIIKDFSTKTKCTEICPENLTLNHAQLSPKCYRAMEYGQCRKWVQLDKLGLKMGKCTVME